jgi:hypothetical protein
MHAVGQATQKFDWQIARPPPNEERSQQRPQPHPLFGEYVQTRSSAICQCFSLHYKLGHVLHACALHQDMGVK